MKPQSKAIIQTLAFYDAVGHTPLTALELYRRLLRSEEGESSCVSFGSFLKEMIQQQEQASLSEYVGAYRGFYFLKGSKEGYKQRVQIGKSGIRKWRIARSMARAISFLPYARMVAVTGSLALHMTHKESDIDVLIVAKRGHIWTTRILVSFFMQIFGRRRHGHYIKDRICLNHYVSDSSLTFRPKNLFSAHICVTFVPIWSKREANKELLTQNQELIGSYFQHRYGISSDIRSVEKDAPFILSAIRSFAEFMGLGVSGRFLEFVCKKVQARRIRRNIESIGVAPGAVIFDDEALIFHHPRPRNQEALHLYEANLKNLGLKT